jgi:GNAT superfamily N-acetyltransferase
MLIDGATVELHELAVEASERRRGIDCALALQALREAPAAGCTTATIGPTPATVPFYEALGFVLERYPPDHCYYTPLD